VAGFKWKRKAFKFIISENYIADFKSNFYHLLLWPPYAPEGQETKNIAFFFREMFGRKLKETNPQTEEVLLDVKKERMKRTGKYIHRLYIEFTTKKTYMGKFNLSPVSPYVR